MKLSMKNAGSTIHLHMGDLLEISLEGNPSTGYQWETVPMQTTLLKQQENWEFKPSGRSPGAGGILTLRFKAVQLGQADFKLIYHRPFEPEEPPAKKFEIKLVVE